MTSIHMKAAAREIVRTMLDAHDRTTTSPEVEDMSRRYRKLSETMGFRAAQEQACFEFAVKHDVLVAEKFDPAKHGGIFAAEYCQPGDTIYLYKGAEAT